MTEDSKSNKGDLQKVEVLKRPRFMGPPLLINDEDPKAYQELLESLAQDVHADGPVDMMWVGLAADYAWNALRMLRFATAAYKILAPDSVAKLHSRLPNSQTSNHLLRFVQDPHADDLAKRWAARDEKAVREVETNLAAAGLTSEAIDAQTLMSSPETFERLQRMISADVARCRSLLREIESRRAKPRQRPPMIADDAEYGIVSEVIQEKKP